MKALPFPANLTLSTLTILSFVTSQPADAASLYSVTDLGTLPGSSGSLAIGINNSGQVIGYSTDNGPFRAFLWEDGVMTDLGTHGGSRSQAWGINDLGQVVGFADTEFVMNEYGHPYEQAFLWNETKGMTDLGEPLGGSIGLQSLAYDINNLGQVVGGWLQVDLDRHAFLWQNGLTTDLGTLGGLESRASDINNFGQVVGESTTTSTDGSTHAFLWDESNGMIDLGTLDSGPVSAATAINDSGQVVGFSITSSYHSIEAFLWEEGLGMSSLGTLGGNWSSAEDINNLGQIVGISSKAANVQDSYAVLWEGSVISDLNSLVPEDSGWLLTNAQGINDAGQIVGAGYINDQFHAFLLTPVSETTSVPEPTSVFGVMLFGALGTGSVLKHRSKKRKSTSLTTL